MLRSEDHYGVDHFLVVCFKLISCKRGNSLVKVFMTIESFKENKFLWQGCNLNAMCFKEK